MYLNKIKRFLIDAFFYINSGWASLSALCLVLALWQLGADYFGELILSTPTDTFKWIYHELTANGGFNALTVTAYRALFGYGLVISLGTILGILVGSTLASSLLARPIITLMVGIPPIAWLVLALIWIGSGHGTPILTLVMAAFPLVFMGALQGMRTQSDELLLMAKSFQLSWWQTLWDIQLPQVLSYVFPAWINALGVSWKVVVMAELLATSDGIGAQLAQTQSQLNTAGTLGWIIALVAILLVAEYAFLEPIKRHVERWRDA